MAQLPRNRPNSFLYESDDLKDISIHSQKIVDGEVFEYENDVGDKFIFKKYELTDIIREAIDKAIKDKNIDLYSEVEERLSTFFEKYINEMELDLMNRFKDKVDEVAERMAIKTLNYRIEEEVQKRLEIKLKEITKIIING